MVTKQHWSRRLAGVGLTCPALLLALAAGPAQAQTQPPIGGATTIRNDVNAEIVRKRHKMREGDQVFQDQIVQTGADSLAKLVFLDLTNMAIGPQSRATLDRFVYNGDGTARQVTVNAAKGAFRFFSGKSAHEAYTVQTPQAVIGVRGTTYDVRIEEGRTMVVLQEGAVNVCVRNSANCRELTQPGQSVEVTDRDIEGPLAPENKRWDFGSLCAGAASDLCTKTTQFALAVPPPNAAPAARQTRKAAVKPPARARTRIVEEPPPRVRRAPPPRRIVEAPPPRRRVARPVIIDEDETIYVQRRPSPLVPLGAIVGAVGGFRPPYGRGPGGWTPPRGGRPPMMGGGRGTGGGGVMDGGRGGRGGGGIRTRGMDVR